jgi:predicted alpha/beta-hydrolase family hydrolase
LRSCELQVPLEAGGAVTALVYAADQPRAVHILGHGAGAGQHSSFMVSFSEALAARGIDTVTFNFPYTEQKRRLPDRRPVLESCYRSVIEAVRQNVPSGRRRLFIGGKSMGGRIATHVAAADPDRVIDGLVLLGYPLHPPGKPTERRDAHLPAVKRPALFVQGSRDAFGTPEEMTPVASAMAPLATLHVVSGGDHSFKVSKAGQQAAVYAEVQQAIVDWIDRISASSP